MTDQPTPDQPHPPGPARRPDGRFTNTVETAEYDARAAKLRVRGLSYRQIAEELGYADHSSARDAVLRAIAAAPVEAGTDARQVELERLDLAVAKVVEVLERRHLAFNNQGVVEDPEDGGYLTDDGPALAAARVLQTLSESRRKLLGLDAETKVAVSGVRYEIVGVDPDVIAGRHLTEPSEADQGADGAG